MNKYKLITLLLFLCFNFSCSQEKKTIKSVEIIFKMSPSSKYNANHTITEYDKFGNQSKEFAIKSKNQNGEEIHELTSEYYYDKNILSKLTVYGNNKINFVIEFTYKNNIVESEKYIFYEDGKKSLTNIKNSYSTYEYLDKTTIIKNYQMNAQSMDFKLETIKYILHDTNKNTIESKTLNDNGDLNFKYSYKYDKKNRRILEITSSGNSREYGYDQYDNVIKEILETKGYKTIFEYTYKYDKFGNWIEKNQKEFLQKKPAQELLSENITIRKLEYY